MRKQQRHGWKGEEEGNKKRRKAITRDGGVKLVIPTRRVMKKNGRRCREETYKAPTARKETMKGHVSLRVASAKARCTRVTRTNNNSVSHKRHAKLAAGVTRHILACFFDALK
jgi:hypothetical protein